MIYFFIFLSCLPISLTLFCRGLILRLHFAFWAAFLQQARLKLGAKLIETQLNQDVSPCLATCRAKAHNGKVALMSTTTSIKVEAYSRDLEMDLWKYR